MQIQSLSIRNFKSIRELEILDVESSLILVGKNNTGKTAVLDAIRAVTGSYTVGAHDFNEKRQNIEIDMVLEITGEDLQQFHAQGLVSGYLQGLFCKSLISPLPSPHSYITIPLGEQHKTSTS